MFSHARARKGNSFWLYFVFKASIGEGGVMRWNRWRPIGKQLWTINLATLWRNSTILFILWNGDFYLLNITRHSLLTLQVLSPAILRHQHSSSTLLRDAYGILSTNLGFITLQMTPPNKLYFKLLFTYKFLLNIYIIMRQYPLNAHYSNKRSALFWKLIFSPELHLFLIIIISSLSTDNFSP